MLPVLEHPLLRLAAVAAVPLTGCVANDAALVKASAQTMAETRALNESHVEGALRLNDASLPIVTCSSGDPSGFHGVELQAADGSRLRLVQEVDGAGTVVRMQKGADPVTMKACGKVEVEPNGLEVGSAKAFRGIARLDCTSGALHLAGSISFNCGVDGSAP